MLKCKPSRLPISKVVMTSTLKRISRAVPVMAVSLALPAGLAWRTYGRFGLSLG